MPTESFLNQKSWHPRSGANLRRLEDAEERARRERKQAEVRAAELERERERLDAAASAGAGPRAELQFMYSPPPGFGAAPGPKQEGARRGEAPTGSGCPGGRGKRPHEGGGGVEGGRQEPREPLRGRGGVPLGVPLGGFRALGAGRPGEEHRWQLKGRAGLFGSCNPGAANQQLVEDGPEGAGPGGGCGVGGEKAAVAGAKARRRAEKRARREEAVRFLESAGLRLAQGRGGGSGQGLGRGQGWPRTGRPPGVRALIRARARPRGGVATGTRGALRTHRWPGYVLSRSFMFM